MGNTQSDGKLSKGVKGKGLKIIRGKRGKSEEPQFTSILPNLTNEQSKTTIFDEDKDKLSFENTNIFDEIQKDEKYSKEFKEFLQESALESIPSDEMVIQRTETPVRFSTELNQCYDSEESGLSDVGIPDNFQESFLHNLALNSFKLNDHKLRREQVLTEKMGKLGVSKTSQISLESDPNESFVSENVEIVTKVIMSDMENKLNEKLKYENEESDNRDEKDDIEKKKSPVIPLSPSGHIEYKRFKSEPGDSPSSKIPSDGLVLKRVASLSLATPDKSPVEVSRPKFVPEKLDFKLYQKFEGHMLINWLIAEEALKALGNVQDLKTVAVQFCTHLLAAGVLQQIPDKDTPMFTIFKPDLMYYWTHSEVPQSVPETPGRLTYISWPPTSPSSYYYTPSSNNTDSFTDSKSPDVGLQNELEPRPESKLSAKEVEILALEDEVKRLKQEIEKYKTLIEIQTLTEKTFKDFGSPEDENKRLLCSNCDNKENFGDNNKKVEDEESGRETMLNFYDKSVNLDVTDQILSKSRGNDLNLNDGSQAIIKLPVDEDDVLKKSSEEFTLDLLKVSPPKVTSSPKLQIQTTPKSPSTSILTEEVKDFSLNPSQESILNLSDLSDIKENVEKSPLKEIIEEKIKEKSTLIPSSPPPTLPTLDSNGISPPVPPPLPNLDLSYVPPPPPPPMINLECVPPPPPLPDSNMGGIPPPPPPMMNLGNVPPPPPPPMMNLSGVPPPPPPPMLNMGGIPPPPPPMLNIGGIPPPPPPMMGLSGVAPPPPPMGGLSGPVPPPMPHPGGPAPLPPPPVGGWDAQKSTVPPPPFVSQVMRKNPVVPPVPMKPLYWTRLLVPEKPQANDQETSVDSSTPLWSQIEEVELEDMNEFTRLFSRQVSTKKVVEKKEETKTKIEPVKLLDSKRSKNVGILAQSLHVEFIEIENAIYNLDTSVINLEALQRIYEARGTNDELELIKSHLESNQTIPLDKPEQFLYDLSKIANFAERISCFMFQVEFDDSISTIEHTLANMKLTSEFLMTSTSLKDVFAVILTLGNYMNGGNRDRGQADGFGLEILSKLRDVKSKDSRVTLLHFIVRICIKKIENPFLPNISMPIPEPGDVERASSIDFDDLTNKLNQLKRQIEACDNRIKKVIESSDPEHLEPFQEKMTSFLENAQKRLNSEQENLLDCKRIFIETMKFYRFKPKKGTLETIKPNEFFNLWLPFCKDFKDIWKKEFVNLEKERIQALRKKENERLAENVKGKKRADGLKAKVERAKKKMKD